MEKLLRPVRDELVKNRYDMGRIAAQTAVATAATYAVMTGFDLPHTSWAVIAALFTIGLSVDTSYRNAIGRIAGASFGVLLGLATAWTVTEPVIIGLVIAAAIANAVAVPWPRLRYAAVTAAIVAMQPSPDPAPALQVVGAIMIGTLVGAATALLILPVFGRDRVAVLIRQALADCGELLGLMDGGTGNDARRRRDAVHARLLSRLETARAAEAQFSPRLANGMPLRQAITAVEALWQAIVILDRALRSPSGTLGHDGVDQSHPVIGEASRAARGFLDQINAAIRHREVQTPETRDLRRAMGAAAAAAADLAAGAEDPGRIRALHTLAFAIAETERSLLRVARVVEPMTRTDRQDAARWRPRRDSNTQPVD